ncbi:MAG TPA: ABC transporter ATP-binding protein [Thermodesulfobacteriota bacterium]|nr:ABC transporter ATP-binding protein [Thermodesulfobacteriota bacterium]
MAEVELKNIRKSFSRGAFIALKDVSLKVPDGTFVTVLGPSGCGKTTLLRLVAGLEEPDGGEILIGGQKVNHVPPSKRNVAMVFQNYALYPHKKVIDNIGIGMRLRGYPKEEVRRKVEDIAQMLKIEELMGRYPRQLSGGQQQRVALARALVREPEVFLLDEPLSNLDAQVRDTTRTELKRLFKEINATVVYVTHDQTEAMMMSDLLVVMEKGTIRQIGDPGSTYRDPVHLFVAQFIGAYRINLIAGRLTEGRFISDDQAITFDVQTKHQGQVLMGIRPEHLNVGAMEDVRLKGEVILVEPLGESNLISLKVGRNELRALSSATGELHLLTTVSFASSKAYFFEAKSGIRLRSGP